MSFEAIADGTIHTADIQRAYDSVELMIYTKWQIMPPVYTHAPLINRTLVKIA